MNRSRLYSVLTFMTDSVLVLALIVAVVFSVTGCSVNVIVAPGASLGIDSNNSRTRAEVVTHYNELVELIPVGEVAYE